MRNSARPGWAAYQRSSLARSSGLGRTSRRGGLIPKKATFALAELLERVEGASHPLITGDFSLLARPLQRRRLPLLRLNQHFCAPLIDEPRILRAEIISPLSKAGASWKENRPCMLS